MRSYGLDWENLENCEWLLFYNHYAWRDQIQYVIFYTVCIVASPETVAD